MIDRRTAALASVALAAAAAGASGQVVRNLGFIGQATFVTGYEFGGTNVGGLSGLAYDAAAGRYYSISDDRSSINPARFYSLEIDLSTGSLKPGGVSFTGVTTLKNAAGDPYANLSLDPEGIAIDPRGGFWISSEGDAVQVPPVNPFVDRFNADGSHAGSLAIPAKYLPTAGDFGIRNNLAFETLAVTPSGRSLYTATENALKQDGVAAVYGGPGSPSRILRFNPETGRPMQEYVYVTDPVAHEPNPPGGFNTNGLVDMLPLGEHRFISIERSFSVGVGNTIRLYEVNLAGATDVSGFDTLPGAYVEAQKTLLLDLDDLGITLDNIEGVAFGPTLAGGMPSLILVSDNNFSSTQFTQFLAFEVGLIPSPSALALLGAAGLWAGRRRR